MHVSLSNIILGTLEPDIYSWCISESTNIWNHDPLHTWRVLGSKGMLELCLAFKEINKSD